MLTPSKKKPDSKCRKTHGCLQTMQKRYLSQAAPYLGLNGRVHLLLVDGHGDELVQDGSDALALGVIVVLAEAHQVGQPGGHVLQAQVLQLNACNNTTRHTRPALASLHKELFLSIFLSLVAQIITVPVEQTTLGQQRSFKKAWQKERATEPMRKLCWLS